MASKPYQLRTAGISLTTAISLGVLPMAGCASFDPNPISTAAKAGDAVGTLPPPTAPAPATAELAVIGGRAMVGDQPLANAKIEVFNAFTDQPFPGVVAAGAGKLVAVGAKNYALQQTRTITTDANGNYSFSLIQVAAGDVLKIVASNADGSLSTILALGEPATSGKYSVMAGEETISLLGLEMPLEVGVGILLVGGALIVGGVGAGIYAYRENEQDDREDRHSQTTQAPVTTKAFQTNLTLNSTVAANLMGGVTKLVGNLKGKARDHMLKELFKEADSIAKDVGKKVNASNSEALFENLTASANAGNAGAAVSLAFKDVMKSLKDSGVTLSGSESDMATTYANLLKEFVKTNLQAALDGETEFNPAIKVNQSSFPASLTLDLSKMKDGSFTYQDENGNSSTVVLTGGTVTSGVLPTGPVTIVGKDGVDDEVDPEAAPGKPQFYPAGDGAIFKPTIRLANTGSSVQIRVAQAAGEDDVQLIVARLRKAETDAVFNAAEMTPINAGATTNHVLVTGSLLAPQTVPPAPATEPVQLSPRMGGARLSSSAYTGFWRDNNGTGKNVAQIQVFEATDFLYLTLSYALPAGIKIVRQHETTLTLSSAVLSLNNTLKFSDTKGLVDIDLYTRKGSFAEFSENFLSAL